MVMMKCPACEERTVHTYVRRPGEVGQWPICIEHTDALERLRAGELEAP
jgi:hypothetical protein